MFPFRFRWLSGSQQREKLEMIIARSQSLVMQWGQHEAWPAIPNVSHCELMFILTKLFKLSHKQLKQTHNKDNASCCFLKKNKKKTRFKNHFQTILNSYWNVETADAHFKFVFQICVRSFALFVSFLLLISVPRLKPSSSHCLISVWPGFIGLSVIPCNSSCAKRSGRSIWLYA